MGLFLVFLCAYTLSQFYRVFLGVLAPEMGRDLSLGPADLGLMTACWSIAFALAQFPVGYGLDRVGPRRTMSATMLAAVLGALLLARATTRGEAFTAMAMIGVGCSPIYMGALYYYARTAPTGDFTRIASWLLAIGSLGNLAATSPLAAMAASVGWRTTVAAVGLATLAAAMLVAWRVRDPDRSPATGGFWSEAIGGIAAVLRIRALWPMLPLITVSYAVILAERGLWVGPFLADVHALPLVERGHVLVTMALAMSAGAIFYGQIDRADRRKTLVVLASLVTAAAFASLALPGLTIVGAAALLAMLGFVGHTYSLLMAHGRDFLPVHLIGRGITFLNFLFLGGLSLVQIASGIAVSTVQRSGAGPAEVFAILHLGFALTLVVATIIYLWTPALAPAQARTQP